MKSSRRSNNLKIIAALSVAVVLVGIGLLGIINRRHIRDTIAGYSYTPDAAVLDIESKVGFTADGLRIFHATQPSVISAEGFNQSCPRKEVASPIIGCYTPQDAIFIYDISNEKLDGIKSVTAVHELMHAVWVRMSPGERDRIGALVEAEYKKMANEQLRQRMQYYERAEAGQEVNELHSILGTEKRSLSPELQRHYSRYFDRNKVVAKYEGYQAQYRAIEDEANQLISELEQLGAGIAAKSVEYELAAAKLESDIRVFNGRASGGSFTGQSQFAAERQRLIARAGAIDLMRVSINDHIKQYNELYGRYRQAAEEIQALNNSLDSFESLKKPDTTQI